MAQPHLVILFYKFTHVADPGLLRDELNAHCHARNIKGRVIIAHEGLNGTLGGTESGVREVVDFLHRDPRFADMEIKESLGDEETFPKLSIKVRPEIVTLKSPTPLEADTHHNHLSPEQWRNAIESDPTIVLVDVRNRYESAVGKFANAVECDIENFRELPAYMDRLAPLKDRKILMYCTGGIRCEKASALFRSEGFTQVYQLHGGIVNYHKEIGTTHWQGECFVFDQRMTVQSPEPAEDIGRCAHTSVPTNRFVNCLHDPCHVLFLLDEAAERENPSFRLCPTCLKNGLTPNSADYVGSPARASATPGRLPPPR
jgi:UPF0176 protein